MSMYRCFTARSGHLAKPPISILASYTTTVSIKPALEISSSLHSFTKYRPSWSEFLKQHPTSVEEIQTVYDACVRSRVFAPISERPIVFEGKSPFGVTKKIPRGDVRFLKSTFQGIQGLKPQDWEVRGINFTHAVNIAQQLQRSNYFSGKKLSDLLKSWPQLLAQVQTEAPGGAESLNGFASAAGTVADGRKALMEANIAKLATIIKEGHGEHKDLDMQATARRTLKWNKGAEQPHQIPKEGSDVAENVETLQADRARRILRQRKKAEQESDADEGIKSKRRPLRLAATSKGVSVTFDSMEKLRRFERRGREITVDKEVKKRTRETSLKTAHQKRGRPSGDIRAPNNSLHEAEHHSSKERRSSASLMKIRKLAERPAEVLLAKIKEKTSSLEQTDLPKSRRKTAERQLERTKQALALQDWEARQKQKVTDRTSRE
ncbi:hypothetical protein N0V93_009272 [Gnomoniopsis smithogilvyi]|uniref:Uncharacterized protein n=1 Tax=Gnomoniopsis smithogilvyi TaxID=1191159 RepID=A0A9W8YMV1_9PEZI|nr:hypothetical protein N0V93_009272 [Gnomoniopsis smithogilvyi]